MKKALLLAIAVATAAALPAYAQTIDDPLQGVCGTCVEVGGVVTQTNSGGLLTNFGFRADPAQGGQLTLVFLVPNITADLSAVPTVSGLGSATLANSGTIFNSGDLQAFLGLSGNPDNPISAFETSFENALVPGIATDGFRVFTLNAGTFASICSCATPADLFSLASALPLGTEIVGILNNNGTEIFTAPSGTLEINQLASVPGPIVGAGLPGLVTAGLALVALVRSRRRRNTV
jgi:hypothetical protein